MKVKVTDRHLSEHKYICKVYVKVKMNYDYGDSKSNTAGAMLKE